MTKGNIINRIRYFFRNFELPLVKFPGALGSVLLLGVIDSTRLDKQEMVMSDVKTALVTNRARCVSMSLMTTNRGTLSS